MKNKRKLIIFAIQFSRYFQLFHQQTMGEIKKNNKNANIILRKNKEALQHINEEG